MLDERLVRKSGAGLLSYCVNIIRAEGLNGIELIAIHAGVHRLNHRPLRPVPVLGKSVPEPVCVLLAAYSPDIGVRDCSNAVENVLLCAGARARNHGPDCTIEMLDE